MKTKLLLGISLCICIFYSCDPENKDIIKPEQPPIEQPEQPNKPEEPEEPQKPEEPAPINGIININNEYMAVGTRDWDAIAFGNGKYVVGGYDYYVTSSTDGINWETPKQLATNTNTSFASIAYGNGKFVATGNKRSSTSTDGVNWTSVKGFSKCGGNKVIFDGTRFIAVGDAHSALSIDGISWTEYQIGGTYDNFKPIIYGNGKYVTINGTGQIYTSTNGENWTKNASSFGNNNWINGTFGNGIFLICGRRTQGGNVYINTLTSTDGENWVQNTTSIYGSFSSITFGNEKFVGTFNQSVYTSIDGKNWELNGATIPFLANDVIVM